MLYFQYTERNATFFHCVEKKRTLYDVPINQEPTKSFNSLLNCMLKAEIKRVDSNICAKKSNQ